MKNSELKDGMWVVCLPGFNTEDNAPTGGGYGYKEDLVFLPTNISHESDDNEEYGSIAWGGNKKGGVHARALRPATPEEISAGKVIKHYEIY